MKLPLGLVLGLSLYIYLTPSIQAVRNWVKQVRKVVGHYELKIIIKAHTK